MVSTWSMTARMLAIAVALRHNVVINIVGLVATSSPQPMANLYSLRATYVFIYLQKYVLLFVVATNPCMHIHVTNLTSNNTLDLVF